ncbi:MULTISPECIES: zinc ribbon domain-containing protein [Lactobacillaceae]|uniref:Zinc-ribbon domain-containing protein n=2 Tax=Secundilactobacillus collinoides TaxID=33960 RepID=A0A0R2B3P1_SECCO|nr:MULTISPECIES: zinc ribbon domain-containing protein [Lactobacillaceae]KRM74049.1 hypothetical protein FC82_GL000824 [Secundilactobacillus collinoides DSM 20515 = JCM 1123]KZL37733.1 hypothetical protein TY91_12400 [Secundilactobacillus collinoides]MCT3395544.1 zinc ribbon domain-containing protein [Lentilactobacillus hilgardii]MCV3742400.1 zinc ribbon domain-containing protein [Lentilactobacillus hilgardii]MDH5106963.1 zinc ribbon domain-containing protein [Lentilactobacillus diolivorans]
MNEELKYCINCGEKIPKEAEFCPFCGSKQDNSGAAIKEKVPSQILPNSDVTKHKPWFKKAGFWIIAVIILIIIGGAGFAFHTQTSQGAVSSVKENVVSDNTDFGNATVKWNKDYKIIEIDLPKNARVIKDLNGGSISVWNSLVRNAKTESAKLNHKYSHIIVPNPSDKSKELLEVQNGEIKYNVGDDY